MSTIFTNKPCFQVPHLIPPGNGDSVPGPAPSLTAYPMDDREEANPGVEKSKQLEQRKKICPFPGKALQPDCSCICLLNTGLGRKYLAAVAGHVSKVILEHKARQEPFFIPIISRSMLAD